MPEFKSCPFCGGTNFYITPKEDVDYLQKRYGKVSIYIRCRSCEVEMWEHSFTEEDYGNRLRLLAENWNRRVSV